MTTSPGNHHVRHAAYFFSGILTRWRTGRLTDFISANSLNCPDLPNRKLLPADRSCPWSPMDAWLFSRCRWRPTIPHGGYRAGPAVVL
jgi:hypothetical protein